MDWVYLAFNGVVLMGPLAAALVFRLPLRQHAADFAFAYGLVAFPWVLLDTVAHWRGWWAYNPDYVLGPRLLGLPFEEILFFITVPWACAVVFIFFSHWRLGLSIISRRVAKTMLLAIAAGMIGVAFAAWGRERTLIDSALVLLTVGVLWRTSLIYKASFWYWNLGILFLFFIFNGFLTGLPVVTYDRQFMTDWRISSIPIEDALYNFSLLNLFLVVFTSVKRRRALADTQ